MADALRWRARNQPERLAYIFLPDGEDIEERETYARLDARARAIARLLQSHHARSERVLLLYPPGLDYIAALFGCMYAGATAVPAYPPATGRVARTLPRLQAIVADCGARLALTTTSFATMIPEIFATAPQSCALRCLATDSLAPLAPDDADFDPAPESLALLQYTSGSTATPKGVMITHANITANQRMIGQAFGSSPADVGVGWLPFYHDMGLIGIVLNPIYAGYPMVMMPPLAFLQRPIRWLRAMSRYRATISGGPNFAYDLCVQRIGAQQRAALDLTSWKVAFNGAEPVRADTLDQFASAFAPSGFCRDAFLPCYGLAEATLIATGGSRTSSPVTRAPSNDDAPGRRPLVGCGSALGEERVLVVDPVTLQPCAPGQEGEIWLAGPNVAKGYWGRGDESERTFRARPVTGEGAFLRTGDLGLLDGGELHVTGRIKDLIIIRGRNLYPQDVEQTVERASPAVRSSCVVAFAIASDGEHDAERLGVAAEINKVQGDGALEAVCAAIVAAVTDEHELAPSVVVLLPRSKLPKTSSGKVQRQAVRAAVQDRTIEAVHVWRDTAMDAPRSFPAAAEGAPPIAATASPPEQLAPGERPEPIAREPAIRKFLLDWMSQRLKMSPAAIDRHASFSSYGLDSRDVVTLTGVLEEWLGRRISPAVAYEGPTVEKLTARLVAMTDAPSAPRTTPALPVAPLSDDEPIAIVGLGCRVPGAADPEALWQLLARGADFVADVPADRLDLGPIYQPEPALGRTYVKRAAMLDRVDGFDARFFGISAREAVNLDPQQRLLLEVAWEALEDAGIAPDSLAGSATAVLVGISTSDYAAKVGRPGRLDRIDAYAGTGTARSTAAGRLSYLLGVHGASLAIDTACSSSLVAVHLGCQSLRNGESDLVLAGGVSLILAPDSFVYLSQLRALAPDGRCKTFDADADGYGRGEGCAVIVLKRLRDALSAGDTVLAVIRGSAVNHDGATNGLTAPNGAAQRVVISTALARAGVLPQQVDYVEAHGTGTPLGDLIELEALGGVMAHDRTTPLRVGSVKTNIGHLEAAAGVIGLVKTVLALQHEAIPPHLNFHRPNLRFPWDSLAIEVPTQSIAWPRGPRERIAGVSSFGLSGTNAHVVIGEAPAIPPTQTQLTRSATLLAWSASSREALDEMGTRLSAWMSAHPAMPRLDVAAAFAHARTGQRYRAAVVAARPEELERSLASTRTERDPSGRPLRVGFLFSGQGSHYASMGAELDRFEAPFRHALDRCSAILDGRLPRSLRSLLFDDDSASVLRETRLTQPVTVALQYALAELWRAWGIAPVAVVGHSVGEIAAACVAGILSIEDALALATERGRLVDALCPRGAMISAAATEERLREAIARRGAAHAVSVAAVNAPELLVFSGDEEHVLAIGEDLAAEGIWIQRLNVSHAFHSPHMDPAVAPFSEAAARVGHRPAGIDFVSTLTGDAQATIDAGYWVQQLQRPVRFMAATRALERLEVNALVEIGPQSTLLALHRRANPDADVLRVPSLDQSGAACKRMLTSLAALFTHGADVRWDEIVGPRRAPAPRLPTYPFQRERYWLDDAPVTDEIERAGGLVIAKSGNGIAVENAVSRAARRPAQAAAPPAPATRPAIVWRLREIVGDLLGLPPETIDTSAALIDMGADSIVVIDGMQRVQQEMDVRIPLRQVWDSLDTIERLADYIVGIRSGSPAPKPTAAPVSDRANGSGTSVAPALAPSMTSHQQAHIAALAERYSARTPGSKRRKTESHPVLADVRAAAGYRAGLPAAQRQAWLSAKELAYPIVGARSKGSRIWDVDGNEYLDFTMGFGVHLFGHGAPFLIEAVEEELRRGAQIGPQSDRAAEAAELIHALTGVERLAFCTSGSEAVMAALRLARARVGRPRIVAFAGSYHGSYDGVLPVIPLTHGVSDAVESDTVVLEYGNPRSLEIIEARADEFSAVIVEPVQSRRPELQPREFLHALREITARHGIALVFDEVLVGFRISQGGAQAHFGVQADIVTYGKIVGGGLPIGVVAGRAEFLDAIDGGAWAYGDSSAPHTETVWLAGTFNKNPLTMAASVAALRHLRSEGPGLQERLNERAARMVELLHKEFARAGAPIEPAHFGSLIRLHMPQALDLFYAHLIEQGIYVWEGRSMFLSTAHDDEDVATVIKAVRGALTQLKEGGFLTGAAPARPMSGEDRGPATRRGAWPVRSSEPPLLFCFPYAGGSAMAFGGWTLRLADVAQVVPMSLPGRDARAGEAPLTDYDALVDLLTGQITRRLGESGRRFALYGHSMGALLAYGAARKLSASGLQPDLLLVSGEPSPDRTDAESKRPAHLLGDAELLHELARHGAPVNPDASGLMAEDLLVLRADLALCHGFRPDDNEPLDCRVVAFAGNADTLAPEPKVAAWARHTRGSFTLHTLPGDHFFIRSERKTLLDLIAAELTGQTARGVGARVPAVAAPVDDATHT